jgi:squalene-hopene/tetraprenyl-beta-curcumene cyclase
MPSLSLPLLLLPLASALPGEQPRANHPTGKQLRQAVARSTGFLAKEGLAWMQKQKCASCHHLPAMVWALNEARNRGYPINAKALAQVTSWALAEKNHAQVFPDLPLSKTRSETDYLGPLLMALGTGAAKDADAAVAKARRRWLDRAVSQQGKDGSWHANKGGRPPVHATKDVQTSWLLLALSDPAPAKGAKDPWQASRQAAVKWLSRNSPADSHQGIALRLLVYQRLGKPAADTKPLLESLLRGQNQDGGWGQTRKMKSDSYATGLALYVLSGQRGKAVEKACRRAQTFLLKSQRADGSWAMTSRAAEPPPPGPAKDLRPISYFGTAWATIGLVRSGPVPKEGKK